jgi:hypothetical protein
LLPQVFMLLRSQSLLVLLDEVPPWPTRDGDTDGQTAEVDADMHGRNRPNLCWLLAERAPLSAKVSRSLGLACGKGAFVLSSILRRCGWFVGRSWLSEGGSSFSLGTAHRNFDRPRNRLRVARVPLNPSGFTLLAATFWQHCRREFSPKSCRAG